MPDRPSLGPGSGVIPGPAFFAEYQTAMKGLWDSSSLPLTNVGGTADDVEADLDWPLTAGLVDGMKFTLTWAGGNGGPMTLRLNWTGGNTPQVDVKSADGAAMGPGDAVAGTRVLIEYIGGEFRVLGGSGEGGTPAYYTAITASGTWTKPPGFGPDARVIIEAWGGGGGGGFNSTNATAGAWGGGGSAYHRWEGRYTDTPASLAITIGAGGLGRTGSSGAGTGGGATTVGSLVSASGGGGGSVPADGTPGGSAVHSWAGNSGAWGAGSGGRVATAADPGGLSYFGGVGGAGVRSGKGKDGQIPGGAGGAGNNTGAGNGGGDGARGEVRIWIVG